MAAWSPTIEGFRSVFRKPALPLAEVAWRWSFGATAFVLFGLGVLEYLDTLPVSGTDLLMLRTRHPVLVSNALSHIVRGSGFRLALAFIFFLSALTILWIVLASIGRAATLQPLIGYIRKRSHSVREENLADPIDEPMVSSETDDGQSGWRLRSLLGLHFLRAALALAACVACVGGVILAGFASSKAAPHPAIAFFLACTLVLLAWMAWSAVSWLLSLASIFVVRQRQDTFGALSLAAGICRDRLGAVTAVGTWFGLAHVVLFMVASSVVTFPLAFAHIVPKAFVLTAILLLTLVYFAIVDTLYIARMAGYVAILEAPPIPLALPVPELPNEPSPITLQPATAMVDQEELILSDHTPLTIQYSRQPEAASSQVDQDERILSDVLIEFVDDKRNGEQKASS